MKVFFTILGIIISQWNLCAQEGYVNDDKVYDLDIRSIKFHIDGLPTSMPIIDLGSPAQLVLNFDDIIGGDRYFMYKVVHCDKDWNTSNISELDYLDGFNDEEVEEVFYSVGTRVDYTNYELKLPNRDTGWKISGNYILLIYDDDNQKPVLSRRFMVAEKKVRITPQLSDPLDAFLLRSHQQVKYTIDNLNFPIINPMNSIFTTVFQNGRWDSAIQNQQPKFTSRNTIYFDQTQRIQFESYKNFRYFDTRTINRITNSIQTIDRYEDRIDVLLKLDKQTANGLIFDQFSDNNRSDINGQYLIETFDGFDDNVQAEYVNVFFNFQPRESFADHDIYLLGKFTDWQLKEEYRLKYDPTRELYRTHSLLKQGYYNYIYVAVNKDDKIENLLEGNWHETENQYTILVYYRKIGERFDRIIGVNSFNSNSN